MPLSEGQYFSTTQVLESGDIQSLQFDVSGNTKTTAATLMAGEDLTNNVLQTEQRVSYLNGSTSQVVKNGTGRFFGFVVNSHSSGTVKIWDNTSAAGTVILNTITFAAGPASWVLPVAVNFTTGLYITVGGTIDYTILYK